MNNSTTTSMLVRFRAVLALTADAYGLPLPVQALHLRACRPRRAPARHQRRS